jgi:hypothetical protein
MLVPEIDDDAVAWPRERQRELGFTLADGRLVGDGGGDAVAFADLVHDERRARVFGRPRGHESMVYLSCW